MAVLSTLTRNLILRNPAAGILIPKNVITSAPTRGNLALVQVRFSGGGPAKITITPSRWQWHKFKDMFHMYLMVGLIPVLCIVLYANIFIGPAKLAPIPEGYEPKYWEYYKNPITRWLSRYVVGSHQQEYEKYMHYIFEENEKMMLRKLESEVKGLIKSRKDYQAWYYRPSMVKYARYSKDYFEKLKDELGD